MEHRHDPKKPEKPEDSSDLRSETFPAKPINDQGISLEVDPLESRKRATISALQKEGFVEADLFDFLEREHVIAAARVAGELTLGAASDSAEYVHKGGMLFDQDADGSGGLVRILWAGRGGGDEPESAIVVNVTDGDGMHVLPGPDGARIVLDDTPLLFELRHREGEVEWRAIYTNDSIQSVMRGVLSGDIEAPPEIREELRETLALSHLATKQTLPDDSASESMEVTLERHGDSVFCRGRIGRVTSSFKMETDLVGNPRCNEAKIPLGEPQDARTLELD